MKAISKLMLMTAGLFPYGAPEMSEAPKGQTRRASTGTGPAALGAGVGMIFGAVFGDVGVGMILGAAFGLVVPGVFERVRRKDNGAG